MENNHDNLELEKNKAWEHGLIDHQELVTKGFEQFVKDRGLDTNKAFELKDRSCRCIDEGATGGIHLAGSGILLSPDKAAEYLTKANIDGIYSHEGCGAAKLAGRDAVEWAQLLAKKMDVPYKGHIGAAEMNRPKEFHDARVVYYDGTGMVNYSQANLPKGFTVSRAYSDGEYGSKELATAVSIAFGDHGFGGRFDEKNPLVVLVLAAGEAEAEILRNEASSSLEQYGGKIKIEVFVPTLQETPVAQ